MAVPAVDVALLPSELSLPRVAGRTAVVVDVLRFSTALVRAFEAGASSAYPVESVGEAIERVSSGWADLACGERGGVRPAGFHLGNSPLEYTPDAVGGRRLVVTTTNGTRALLACTGADRVFVGALRNAAVVADRLADEGRPVLVVCAGTEGRFALEDALAAGAIVQRLAGSKAVDLSDGARVARTLWEAAQTRWPEALGSSDHAHTLTALGFHADVAFAALAVPGAPVPVWDPSSGRVVPLFRAP